jgi:hypothetical protein
MSKSLSALLAASIIAFAPLPGRAVENLNLSLPGADQKAGDGKWYALSIEGKALALAPVKSQHPSDWTTTSTVKEQTSSEKGMALDLPAAALFAVQDLDGAFAAGSFNSVLEGPVTLRAGLALPLGGKWTLGTEYQKRPDGEMLAGSLSLVATNGEGQRQVIVPPASGMAFARQELLWLGHAKQSEGWDAVVRRTWLTGQVEYVVRLGGATGFAVEDKDHPTMAFRSGIEESKSEIRNTAQTHDAPSGKFGIAAFNIGEEAWKSALDKATAAAKPATLFDRKLMLVQEQVRFTADYLPRWQAKGDEPQSGNGDTWSGPVVLRAYYHGASQPLLEMGEIDGAPLRVQVGTIDGIPAVEVYYQPDGNNVLTYHWIWNEETKRFQRLSRNHEQGC